jgi:hypothetical protein
MLSPFALVPRLSLPVVVHVMTADQREYYDLESFYGAAEEVDLPFDTEATVSDVDTWSKTF